ncbi:MAG TPA: ABC transporter ATP-binding protein [Gemmatimonadaceae bacterium]|nr:ABC transporter ATP-binding protein [Gemmatimonadaceae bacterium]
MHPGRHARRDDAAGNDASWCAAARGRAAGHPPLIEFQGVGHTYRSLLGRTIRAVDDFSLTIGESEVFGLAGPNGAGKSTLISLLLGYLEPTDGTVRIAGMRPRAFVESHGMGYVSELVAIPPRWKLEETLTRYAILAGIPRRDRRDRIAQVTALLGLEEQRGKRVKQLSKGNLQRLGLAQALLRDEQVIILDEPTHGLDPVWTQRFRDVVEGLRRPGRAIFIASHNLDELQRLADRVAIIDRGKLQRIVEPRAGASVFAATPYLLTMATGAEHVAAVFPGAQPRGEGEFVTPSMNLAQLNAGIAALVQRGALIRSVGPSHSVLEQHFREAVRE